MTLNLNNLEGLPDEFLTRLSAYDEKFHHNRFWEHFGYEEEIQKIIADIDEWCLKNKVIGYHYTKAFESEIKQKGLISRPGDEIRNEFMRNHFHLFSDDEQKLILQRWEEEFGNDGDELRDYIVNFVFTLKNGGIHEFTSYYGGEQVYLPIYEISSIGDKLKGIGTPKILKCVLDPNDMENVNLIPFGKIAVSTYHRTINSDALIFDVTVDLKKDIHPDNIEIIKLNQNSELKI